MSAVERGRPFLPFVAGEAARIECCALAAKRCLGVPPAAALEPFAAAAAVGITVHGDAFFARFGPAERRQVLELGGSHWSAGTILADDKATIILNPTHDPVRQKVTLAEELAHIVIGHPPSRIDACTGFRTYDHDLESEAYGVGGAMVMPYGQLFPLVRGGAAVAEIAKRFSVSIPFTNYRINRAGLRRLHQGAGRLSTTRQPRPPSQSDTATP